jgi:hypothetical protein
MFPTYLAVRLTLGMCLTVISGDPAFTLVRILIQLVTLMLIRIRLFNANPWDPHRNDANLQYCPKDPSRLKIESSGLHDEPPRPHCEPSGSM